MLTLKPSRFLPFHGPRNQDMTSSIQLVNRSTTRIAFKIKTNAPKQLLSGVPKTGVIEPNQEQTVLVTLSAKLFDVGQTRIPYGIQVLSTEYKRWADDLNTVWKNARKKISVQELSICFVDNDVGHQNAGSTVAPVFNFAPVPSTVHMFGGTVIVQDDQQKGQGSGNWAPKPVVQPTDQVGAWDQQVADPNGCWDQPAVNPGTEAAQPDWDANQANDAWNQPQQPAVAAQSDDWDEPAQVQNDEWGQQPAQNDAWDNQQQNDNAGEYYDDGNQAQANDNNQDWAAAPANNNFLESEILATTFRVWRESIVYAIGFFILGILLGKAGL